MDGYSMSLRLIHRAYIYVSRVHLSHFIRKIRSKVASILSRFMAPIDSFQKAFSVTLNSNFGENWVVYGLHYMFGLHPVPFKRLKKKSTIWNRWIVEFENKFNAGCPVKFMSYQFKWYGRKMETCFSVFDSDIFCNFLGRVGKDNRKECEAN